MLATFARLSTQSAGGPPSWRLAATVGAALALGCAGADPGAEGAVPPSSVWCGGEQVVAALSVAELAGLPGDDDDLDFDDISDLDDEMPADVGPLLTRQVSRLARRLRDDGQLGEGEWQLGTAPPDDFRYARVDVDDDDEGALDGYRTAAWVPVDDAGRPAGDDVYMVRQGGIAGWRFTAGPFTLPATDGVELGPQDDGRPIYLSPGVRLVVRLPQGAAAARPWRAAAGSLTPQHTEVLVDDQELVVAYDLSGLAPGTYALALEQAGAGTPGARFDVPVTITSRRDARTDVDGW